jgi:protein-arginine kinase activator protein McsA
MCSHCKKDKPIMFTYTQAINKEADRKLDLCANCSKAVLSLLFIFNTEIPNKIFNYINLLPPPPNNF